MLIKTEKGTARVNPFKIYPEKSRHLHLKNPNNPVNNNDPNNKNKYILKKLIP